MKLRNVILCFIFVLLNLHPDIYSQLKDVNPSIGDVNRSAFYLDPLVFYSKDSAVGRLDLYIELRLESLQFKYVSTSEHYDAAIDYIVTIVNSNDKTLFNNTYSDNFSNTENEQKHISTKSVYDVKQFYLQPDKYKLSFLLRDKNSSNEYTRDTIFYVRDYLNKELSYSSLMLLSDYKIGADGKKEITPIVNDNIGNYNEFFVFFEIINRTDVIINKDYSYSIYNEKGRKIESGNMNYNLQPGVNKEVEKITEKNFIIGDFKLEITDKNSGEVLAQKIIKYYWEDLPVNIKDLDAAVDELIYIATSDEISYIRKAKTYDEKERRFLKFWKDKNSNANTTKNNIMVEYYNRIKIANQRYSHYTSGWKTDMGMVYIIYGDPSNIDRHPFDTDAKPYEIWDYYDVNKRFIFVDYTGFGDYRLVTPFYESDKNRLHF